MQLIGNLLPAFVAGWVSVIVILMAASWADFVKFIAADLIKFVGALESFNAGFLSFTFRHRHVAAVHRHMPHMLLRHTTHLGHIALFLRVIHITAIHLIIHVTIHVILGLTVPLGLIFFIFHFIHIAAHYRRTSYTNEIGFWYIL